MSNKYLREITGVDSEGRKTTCLVDVYAVIHAWGVTNPALQHLIKKALQAGDRGHKDRATDLNDIVLSAIRAQELEQ